MNTDWRAWEDDLSIQSSENVNFSVETAGVGSRLGAAFVDSLIQIVTIILIVIAAVWARSYLPNGTTWVKWFDSVGGALLMLLIAVIWLSYHFLFEWLWDGQTPGKRWNGLRVLQNDGMPAGMWPIAVRNLLRTIDFLPFGYAVGGATALLSSHNRRIGDMVAGTIVAREKHEAGQRVLDINQAADAFLASFSTLQTSSQTSPNNAANVTNAFPTSIPISIPTSIPTSIPGADVSLRDLPMDAPFRADAPPFDVKKLNAEDREFLLGFLSRRDKLKPDARARLAHSLATRIAAKIQLAPPSRDESEAFLTTLLMVLHEKNRE